MKYQNNKPELTVLDTGSSLKTLKITALKGMQMSLHHATHETVVIVQRGKAILTMDNVDHCLPNGKSITIPAKHDHSLKIEEDFEALAIMAMESTIEFK